MPRYRKKPVVVDAAQWREPGDHPAVFLYTSSAEAGVVDFDSTCCKQCGVAMFVHGWIETLEGKHIVCPGDYVITGVKGEHYPCKPDIFAETYERADRVATLREVARTHLKNVLRELGGNKTKAAEVLGIDRRTLYRKLQREQIT